MEGFHAQIKHLDKLLTNEEKVQKQKDVEYNTTPDTVTQKMLERESGDYMRRQPRVDLSKTGNYNFT